MSRLALHDTLTPAVHLQHKGNKFYKPLNQRNHKKLIFPVIL